MDGILSEPVPSVESGFGEALAEVYAEGRLWDRHKGLSQDKALQAALEAALGHDYAQEVARCSVDLVLGRDRRDGRLRVRPLKTCRRRWCPVCAWRKSLRQWALLCERLPGLIEQHGPVRWLMLTLTVRNCQLDQLPATVDAMGKAFRRLTHPSTALGRQWPATAWLRCLEVTFPRPGEAHPHYHALLAVRPSYFSGREYIPQDEWCRRWREAARLDYAPVVDVRRVRPMSPEVAQAVGEGLAEALGGLREVAKYVVKPADLASADAARGLMLLKGRRFVDGGGWLRGVLSEHLDEEAAQMELPEIEDVATFWWRAAERVYRRRLES